MQKSGGITAASKRPSRRHRRRPRNLLQDYERRKRKHAWLETHIWHAKRFHMAEIWGYKVPLHPNDRGVRAAYRDSVNKCLAFVRMYLFRLPSTFFCNGTCRYGVPALFPSYEK